MEQERDLQETTARLEERERMVHDLSEFNEINRLLITRSQEHEDLEVDLDDEEIRQRHSRIGNCFRRTGRSSQFVGSSTPARPRHAKLTRDFKCK